MVYVGCRSTGHVYATVLTTSYVHSCKTKKTINNAQFFYFFRKMVLEWCEREHEELDNEVVENEKTLESLQLCGFKIFFELNGMWLQHWMLELLVIYWDLISDAFLVDVKPLRIEVDDIYFLTRLS